MKQIYLLRHAKSSWKDAELSDIDRPLNTRGKTDAPVMGKHLHKKQVRPQLIISSPAKRAFKTATLIAPELGYEEKNIRIDMSLYGANAQQIHQLLLGLESGLNKVMLIGHNPAFTLAVSYFTGEEIDNLPTCGMVRIDFHSQRWELIKAGKGKLKLFEYPKKLIDLEKGKRI